ncbi:hypothetical protein DEU56DRAFT_917751 [Suillus clintonianus]|uniref:uncharacterized protein n=1 Tax=Suillus clintonianus TaxID=1904413 RepID=UPI001B862722|nr:uncharacterized protein DEU56DRAFT_917751 [Suillus clintonianus]KAG2122578.1 hypothetical protein DEU56DRAFT_917751 [Suillus clintonianus]
MGISKEDTITKFNEQINMTPDELEPWLASDKSHQAGTGVGLVSGAKIVDILKKNPDMDPGKYEEGDLDHMRKVVGYNSRHLVQEDHLKETKTKEELANTKSTISFKNWGHDPVKALEEEERAECHNQPGEFLPQEPGDSRKAGKFKRSDNGEEPLASKRKRDTTDGRVDQSNGDAEEETLARNRGKSKKSRQYKSPTRKSARNRKALMKNH